MSRKEIKENKISDEDLIRQFQADDRDVFSQLMERYMDMIFNLCYKIMGDYDDANDSAQDVFVKVYNNLDRFRFKSSFSTWIYRISINTCKNNLTSKNYRAFKKMIRIDKPRESDNPGTTVELKDNRSNPESMFEKKEKQFLIEEAIDKLPAIQKILIVLRDIEGRSYDEIAEITGLKDGTVKSKLSRARHSLRDLLRGVI